MDSWYKNFYVHHAHLSSSMLMSYDVFTVLDYHFSNYIIAFLIFAVLRYVARIVCIHYVDCQVFTIIFNYIISIFIVGSIELVIINM